MTHDELLAKVNEEEKYLIDELYGVGLYENPNVPKPSFLLADALRAVVELHKPTGVFCAGCGEYYDACTTIKIIEKELG
jgi:hypothetical protein